MVSLGIVAPAVLSLFGLLSLATVGSEAPATPQRIYCGTFAGGDLGGIYTGTFDQSTGEISALTMAAKIDSPSFLVKHPTQPYLYAIGEENTSSGRKSVVAIYKTGAENGTLDLLEKTAIGPTGDCHLAISKDGRYLATANYSTGVVLLFEMASPSKLGAKLGEFQHKGTGPNKGRQEGPHAHSVDFDPTGKYLLSADLGADRVFVYSVGSSPKPVFAAECEAGVGPRHIAFDKSGKRVYVVNEMDATVTRFSFDPSTGAMARFEKVSLMESSAPRKGAAEIAVHPSGKWLLASNRLDENTVSSFALEGSTGQLGFTSRVHKPLTHPRHFVIDPSGKWVLVGSMDADEVRVVSFDSTTGGLTLRSQLAKMPKPTCIVFAQ